MRSRSRSAAKGETVTEGLDGLRERLAEYAELGARFAKWRATYTITDELPVALRDRRQRARARALRRALPGSRASCRSSSPRCCMDGDHTIERSCRRDRRRAPRRSTTSCSSSTSTSRARCSSRTWCSRATTCKQQASDAEIAERTVRVLPLERARGGARDRVPVRWSVRRAGHRAAQRDEQAGPAPVAAVVLVRARTAGAGAQGVEGRGGERRRRPGRRSRTAPR